MLSPDKKPVTNESLVEIAKKLGGVVVEVNDTLTPKQREIYEALTEKGLPEQEALQEVTR